MREVRRWTPEDDAFLREHYTSKGATFVANALKRTYSATTNRAKTLQLQTRHRERYGAHNRFHRVVEEMYMKGVTPGIIAETLEIPVAVVSNIVNYQGMSAERELRLADLAKEIAAKHQEAA